MSAPPMMATPLLEQVRSGASAAVIARVESARAEAEAIRAAATDAAARRRSAAVAERERGLSAQLERVRAEAAQRVGRDVLTARAAALDRVFAAAAARFPALAGHPGLAGVLGETIRDAFTYLPDGPVVVRCTAAVAPAARTAVVAAGRDASCVRCDDAAGTGVAVEAGDGTVVVDATFERRLARERARLAIVVAQSLRERDP